MQKVLFLFGELNDDDIDWILSNGTIETITPGTILIEKNQSIDKFYILLDGAVSVSLELENTNSKEIAILSSGEIFGEISFMDALPPSANVVAVQESLVLSITRQKLSQRLQQDSGFAARFYKAIAIFLSSRLRSTVRHLGYLPKINLETDHLTEEVLNNLPMARARFDWLLRRLKNPLPALDDY
jgi:CRP/FNR family transcriptional regulator, cyclic AMP receptor protein